MPRQFPIVDELTKVNRFCATIARLTYREKWQRGLLPEAFEPTATVTFIKFEGSTYAVTAHHVINIFEDLREQERKPPEGYFCPVHPGVSILGPFIQPPAPLFGRQPDVAICPINPELPAYIGKEAFVVEPRPEPPEDLTHALACGFPTVLKAEVNDGRGAQLKLPNVNVIAESTGTLNGDQVQFYSELPVDPSILSLSGMSGGPVFWSTTEEFGLLGFVKEAMDVKPIEGEETLYEGPRAHFVCERASYNFLNGWIYYINQHWQSERDKIASELSEQ